MLIEGALILLVGIIIGRLTAYKRTVSTPPAVLSGATICGCGHHLSLHTTKRTECHGTIPNPAFSKDYYVSKSNPKQIQCTCKQFVATDNSAEIVATWNPPVKELG